MYNISTGTWDIDDKIVRLKAEKAAGNELQHRKHKDWDDNYELYRGRVRTNRLTQRQAINIPLMKETVKTLLSKMDEAPNVDWKELGGDEDKEILLQELWDMSVKENKLELVDIIDKKNVLLYGIGTRKLNLSDSGVRIDALDPYDVVFDPLMSVGDVESARFIIHQNIFRSVREILASDRYTEKGKEDLKMWVDAPPGIVQGQDNIKRFEEKMQRLKAMGVMHDDFKHFAGGDRLVNLTEHFRTEWDALHREFERRVCVYADETVELMDERLVDVLGVDFWPFVVWTEDPESTDIYSDSIADLVRVPNKVINVWTSQLIENRTLKNFQMHWYLPGGNYTPQTYTPGAGVMLPAPPGDDINKVIKPVEISGLDDTLEAINWITQIVERGSGATAIEKGEPEKGVQTLGEVQILVGKATERSISMAKFYRMAYYELCTKWYALLEANAPKLTKLYKVGRDGKMYTKKVYASDWTSEEGYEPSITSSSEQEENEIKSVQKWQYVLSSHPNNMALRKIALKRELELLDLSPEELKQVEDDEQKAIDMAEQQAAMAGGDMSQIENQIGELTSMAA